MYGYTREETVGRNITVLHPPERGQEFKQICARVQNGESVRGFETVRLHKDGTPIAVALTASFVESAERNAPTLSLIMHDVRERKQHEQDLASITEQERQRLGRELHDTVGQEVSATSMLVTTLAKQLGEDSASSRLIAQIESHVNQVKLRMRELSRGLFPVALDSAGMQLALERLATEISDVYRIPCRLECEQDLVLADNFRATQLFLIVREATYNAAQHAAPSEIVILVEQNDTLAISVRDDGIGLSPQVSPISGMGLQIMHQRARLLGAVLDIESPLEGGTVVTCRMSTPA